MQWIYRHPADCSGGVCPQQANKRVITHGYKPNIEIAANVHFLAAQPAVEPLEFSLSHSPLRWQTTNEHSPVETDGYVRGRRDQSLASRSI
jgi:hypothetical protein